MKILRTTSLGSNLTGSYKKEFIYLEIDSNYLRIILNEADDITSNFLKAVFHKLYLVHS